VPVAIDVILPVFGLILLGWTAGRARVLGSESSEALNRFVYYFALPALLFLGMARVPLAHALQLPFFACVLGAIALAYALAAWISRSALGGDAAQVSVSGLAAVFANTGYMGIPLFLTMFGPDGTLPAVIATIVNSAVVIGGAMMIIEWHRHRGRALGDVARAVALALLWNPLVVAPLAGLAFGASGLSLAKPLATLGDLLAGAAGPCALFALGLFLATRSTEFRPGARPGSDVVALVAVKLVVHPLVTWAFAAMIGLDAFWTASAVILAALPTGALVFVVATQYGVLVERTSTVILVSTVLSVIPLSLAISYLAPL
jgi:predicted permease